MMMMMIIIIIIIIIRVRYIDGRAVTECPN